MNLKNKGFDNNQTYFEHNLKYSNKPTIFIHGVGLDNSMWNPQKKYFHDKEIIFYDLLNHGKTKKGFKNLNFKNFSEQLNNLISFLKIDSFNLVGFSIGALIAQHFTNHYFKKINKLILIASVYKRSKEEINNVQRRFEKVLNGESISDDSINRWFNKEYLDRNPKVYDFFFKILEKKRLNDFIPAYRLFVESDNYVISFDNFKMPTLIMTGEQEVGSTPRMSHLLHDIINNSELQIIPNAKHMATFEKSDLVNIKISKFLS
tara:strand:- start:952 stop:1737 length:786 start_codon:yes stop_codon:yes gene_type:complete